MKNNKSGWKGESILNSSALESAQWGLDRSFPAHPPYIFSHSLWSDLALGEQKSQKMKRENSFEFGADGLNCGGMGVSGMEGV